MSAPLNTDTAVLAQGAEQFHSVNVGLRQEISKVESSASELMAHWRGAAGSAAQEAFIRFQEAAVNQTKVLDEIATNIHGAGVGYAGQDDDQAGVLGSTVNITL
jgi:WXG100 family type VII secretion target